VTTPEATLKEIAEEQANLDRQVAEQNLSAEEVARMNAEGANLDRMLSDLKIKSREVNKAALSLEIAVTKRSDVVEQALEEYMALVYKLGLHPNPPAEFSHISFVLELNGAASEPRNLIQGESLRGIIKPAVLAVAEAKRRERGILNDERVKLENDLDVVTVECENLEQEGATMESRIRLTNSEVEEIREVRSPGLCYEPILIGIQTSQRDLNASTMEINRLETELAHARAAAKASGVGVAARLKSLQIA
jgi:kinetochore protein NDC80